jgi:hypothetical protein
MIPSQTDPEVALTMADRLKLAFSVLFFALLLLPTVQWAFRVIPMTPVVEHRQKEPLPADNPLIGPWNDRSFSMKVSAWFNDNYSMRDFYIRAANQLKYSLFGESDQVYIGRDGWVLDKIATMEQTSVDSLSDQQIDNIVNNMERFQRYLKNRGITLVLVPVPWKNTLYTNLDQEMGLKRPPLTGYGRLTEALRRAGDFNVIDVVQDLKKAVAAGHQAYFKTDIHWTYAGAHEVASDLVRTLWRLDGVPNPDLGPEETFARQDQPMTGGDAETMSVFWPPTEYPESSRADEASCASYDVVPLPDGRDKWLWRPGPASQGRPLLPKSMILGNSYMLYFTPCSFGGHFSSLDHGGELFLFDRLDKVIPDGTHFLIFEFFELEIAYQLAQPDWHYWTWLDKYD